jgi:hypothetical protein
MSRPHNEERMKDIVDFSFLFVEYEGAATGLMEYRGSYYRHKWIDILPIVIFSFPFLLSSRSLYEGFHIFCLITFFWDKLLFVTCPWFLILK